MQKDELDRMFSTCNSGIDPQKGKALRNSYYEFLRELGMKLNMCDCPTVRDCLGASIRGLDN